MKTIEELYRNFYRENVDGDREKELIQTKDAMAILTMQESGYSKITVMDFIHSVSHIAKQLKKDGFKDYFEEICLECEISWETEGKLDKSRETYRELMKIYKDVANDMAEEFDNCYFDLDIKIFNLLLDRGFLFTEVDKYFNDNNFFGNKIFDRQKIFDYVDRVVKRVRAIRREKSETEKNTAKNKYRETKEIISNKYTGEKAVTPKQEIGEIALSLLVKEKFLYETVFELVTENNKTVDNSLVKEIMESCGKIKLIYSEINEANLRANKNDFESVYFAVVKKYIERNSVSIISFDDECQIIKEIMGSGFWTDKYIRKNLSKVSPVAIEPWRNMENYVKAVLENLSENALQKENNKKLVQIETQFLDFYEEIQNKNQSSLANTKDYNLILTVRELVVNHTKDEAVIQILYKVTKNKDKNYVDSLLEKAKRVVAKENGLKDISVKKDIISKVIASKSLTELKQVGIGAFDVYKIILERKIYETPSISNRLYEEFLDADIAETCLSKYVDFNKEELKNIISESPHAVLLSSLNISDGKTYADKVVKEAEKRLQKAYKIQEEKETMEKLFNNEDFVINQGIDNDFLSKNPYRLTRSALKLLALGYDELSVKNMVLNNALKLKIDEPEFFANDIMLSAKKIYNRMTAIKNYKEESSKERDAKREYLYLMNKKYLAEHTVNTNMDIDAIAEMLLNEFSKTDIIAAVFKNSPLTVGNGRTEKYVSNYLIPQAEGKIIMAKKLLAKSKPIARENKKENILEEYLDLQNEIKNEHPILPYDMLMEELVVASLAIEHFDLEELKNLLDTHSPFKGSQSNYGESMVNRILAKYLSKTV